MVAVTRMGAGDVRPSTTDSIGSSKGVAAVGPGANGGAGEALAVLLQVAGVGQQLGVAMAGGQFVEAAVADGVGGALGGEVASAFIGCAHVAQDQLQDGFDQLAAFVEL